MRIWNCIAAVLLLATSVMGQDGFSTAWIDKSADACTSFYQYACGTWMEKNPIPSDQSRWGTFNVLHERNQTTLREILDSNTDPSADRSQIEQQIGDYYGSCMDEEAIEKKGLAPLKPVLDRISAVKSVKDLPAVMANLHRININALFGFGPMPDLNNSSVFIADVDQSGLGLPERDYYFRDDDKAKEQREKYVAHVQRMFELFGESPRKAAADAIVVMRIETALARGSMEIVKRRDPNNVWHKMPVADLVEMAPNFEWNAYFTDLGAPEFTELNVSVPDFMKTVNTVLAEESIDNLKIYLTWHALTNSAALLPQALAEEDFNFYRKTLSGAKEMRPRWKRCVTRADRELGEALGQAYVEKAFPPESKKRMLELVAALEKALADDIDALPWMTKATKDKAREKLDAIKNKIGYPDEWRDYSGLKVVRGDALGNFFRAHEHESDFQLAKIGGKVDPNEWHMTPPTVNAYYHPMENTINFPAGILQPPFFDATLDDAVNFGAIGAVIGHEMTHGFDDSGRRFAANGNLEDWWTADDAANFEAKAKCFIDQYSSYVAVDDVKLNGNLTLGENVADNGGLNIAFMALMDSLEGMEKEKIDGYSPAQRFFLGWAQVWCTNYEDEAQRLQAQTDPHSTAEHRVNGVVSNMPQFREAFGCTEGQPMVRESSCKVW
jgi:putative endopeptidase